MKKDKELPKEVPSQKEGGKTDAEARREFSDADAAKALFQVGKERMLAINSWKSYAGLGSADFRLTDSKGNLKQGEPKEGDLIRVDLPAPGSKAGGGYDWVEIEKIEEHSDPEKESQSFSIRVRPTFNPHDEKEQVAHFFTDDASSTFTIQRMGTLVRAGEHGRNEIPNIQTESLLDKARNAVVGTSAMAGISVLQWKALAEGWLKD
jgi:hypothetical protein